MTDKDTCVQVSSLLPMSCRSSADAFARSLHVRLTSLDIDHQDQDDEESSLWHRNGQQDAFEYPLSPEEEVEDPLSNKSINSNHINPDELLQTQEIHCNGYGDCSNIVPYSPKVSTCENGDESSSQSPSEIVSNSPVENLLESCSSVEEIYETASDHSGDDDDEETWNETFATKTNNSHDVTPPSILVEDYIQLEPDEINSSKSNKETSNSPDGSLTEGTPKIRRCSSLKTGKTPPGTPGCKKIVRFADALGLDLADVKTFVDEIPKIPTSAYNDLRNLDDENDVILTKPIKVNKPEKTLIPLFQQPGGLPDFLEVVRNNYVSLENALVDDPVTYAIRGLVRVRNIDFHKSVFIRYSVDFWKSFVDVPATYVENSCDGFSDKFTFLVYANMLGPGQSFEFAVVFQARGEQFWDNNKGVNYCFQCMSTYTPPVVPTTHVIASAWGDDHWGASFY